MLPNNFNLLLKILLTASYRLELHKRLLLPENRPLMRPSNKYVVENERQQGIHVNGSMEILKEETVYGILNLKRGL